MSEKQLYIITNGSLADDERKFQDKIVEIISRESKRSFALVLREQVGNNPASDKLLYTLGLKIKDLCVKHDIKLIMHRRLDIALAINADGVHLNAASLSIAQVRKLAKDSLLVGYSAHSIGEILNAEKSGADYVFLSPIFASLSKPDHTRPPLGIEALTEISGQTSIPVIALGGITPINAQDCISAGAFGYASIGSLWKE